MYFKKKAMEILSELEEKDLLRNRSEDLDCQTFYILNSLQRHDQRCRK